VLPRGGRHDAQADSGWRHRALHAVQRVRCHVLLKLRLQFWLQRERGRGRRGGGCTVAWPKLRIRGAVPGGLEDAVDHPW
jgi:hypothetical protein